MKLLNSVNADVSNPIVRVQAGKYKHLFLAIENGVSSSAVALTDLAASYITMTKNGIPIIGGVNLISVMHIANLFGGRVESAFAANAYSFLIPILCYDIASPDNVLLVRESDNVSIQIQWGGNFNSYTTSATLNLYGEVGEGAQNYLPILTQYTYGSSTGLKEKLQGENFTRLYIRGMDDTDITRVQIVVDGELVHDAGRLGLLYGSNWQNNVEDATALGTSNVTNTVFAHLPIATNGHIGEFLSDSVEIGMIIASGGASPEVITQCIRFTPDDQAISMASAQSSVNTKIQRKVRAGNSDAVQVISRAQSNPIDISAFMSGKG
jgi:hypothetical protein